MSTFHEQVCGESRENETNKNSNKNILLKRLAGEL